MHEVWFPDLVKVKGPKGLVLFVVPVFERIIRVDLRIITHDVPGQDI